MLGALSSILCACGNEPDRPAPFPGARWIELPSFETGAVASAEEVAELVAALAEAYGGREARANACFVGRYDVFAEFTADPMSNRSVKSFWCRPDRHLRVEVDGRAGTSQRLWNAAGAFLALRGQALVQTKHGNEVHVQQEYELMRLPESLWAEGVKVRPLAPVEFEGVRLLPLEVSDAYEPIVIVYVDPWGPVIRRSEVNVPILAMTTSGKATHHQEQIYSEFERHDGLLVPGRIDYLSEGKRVSLHELVEFEVVERIDDARFEAR